MFAGVDSSGRGYTLIKGLEIVFVYLVIHLHEKEAVGKLEMHRNEGVELTYKRRKEGRIRDNSSMRNGVYLEELFLPVSFFLVLIV